MALWFIDAESDDGTMQLFTHGKTPTEAVDAWKQHYAGWDMPPKVTAYCLRTAVRGPGNALPWENIQRAEIAL